MQYPGSSLINSTFSFSHDRARSSGASNKINVFVGACLALLLSCYSLADGSDANGAAEGKDKKLTEVVIVDLHQAKRLYDLGAVFIDVRNDEEWRLGHIKNARHVNFRKNFVKLKSLDGIDKETPLVFYCAMLECTSGPYASAVSIEWGFENVFYFQRGYFSWMLEDYPVDMNNEVTTFAGDTIQIRRAPKQNSP